MGTSEPLSVCSLGDTWWTAFCGGMFDVLLRLHKGPFGELILQVRCTGEGTSLVSGQSKERHFPTFSLFSGCYQPSPPERSNNRGWKRGALVKRRHSQLPSRAHETKCSGAVGRLGSVLCIALLWPWCRWREVSRRYVPIVSSASVSCTAVGRVPGLSEYLSPPVRWAWYPLPVSLPELLG